MKTLIIEITGEDVSDLINSIEEVTKQVQKEFTSGFDCNDTSSYSFNINEDSHSES